MFVKLDGMSVAGSVNLVKPPFLRRFHHDLRRSVFSLFAWYPDARVLYEVVARERTRFRFASVLRPLYSALGESRNIPRTQTVFLNARGRLPEFAWCVADRLLSPSDTQTLRGHARRAFCCNNVRYAIIDAVRVEVAYVFSGRRPDGSRIIQEQRQPRRLKS